MHLNDQIYRVILFFKAFERAQKNFFCCFSKKDRKTVNLNLQICYLKVILPSWMNVHIYLQSIFNVNKQSAILCATGIVAVLKKRTFLPHIYICFALKFTSFS